MQRAPKPCHRLSSEFLPNTHRLCKPTQTPSRKHRGSRRDDCRPYRFWIQERHSDRFKRRDVAISLSGTDDIPWRVEHPRLSTQRLDTSRPRITWLQKGSRRGSELDGIRICVHHHHIAFSASAVCPHASAMRWRILAVGFTACAESSQVALEQRLSTRRRAFPVKMQRGYQVNRAVGTDKGSSSGLSVASMASAETTLDVSIMRLRSKMAEVVVRFL